MRSLGDSLLNLDYHVRDAQFSYSVNNSEGLCIKFVCFVKDNYSQFSFIYLKDMKVEKTVSGKSKQKRKRKKRKRTNRSAWRNSCSVGVVY